jgi:hypothetical protein
MVNSHSINGYDLCPKNDHLITGQPGFQMVTVFYSGLNTQHMILPGWGPRSEYQATLYDVETLDVGHSMWHVQNLCKCEYSFIVKTKNL